MKKLKLFSIVTFVFVSLAMTIFSFGTDFPPVATLWKKSGTNAVLKNSSLGIGFNAVTDTIAGIQNQNLVDKSASETISGNWSHSGTLSGTSNWSTTGTLEGATLTEGGVAVLNSTEVAATYDTILKDFTGQVTVQAFTADDTTPDVSLAATMVNNVYQTSGTTNHTITDFDDGDDHSEFADGDWFVLYVDDGYTTIDFSSGTSIVGNAAVDFTGSATQPVQLLFIFQDSKWNCVNLNVGMSTPTNLGLSSITMGGIILGDSTPDAAGELGYASTELTFYNGSAAVDVKTEADIPDVGDNPTTNVAGQFTIDTNDGAFEVYLVDLGGVTGSFQLGVLQSETFTFPTPDDMYAETNKWPLKQFTSTAYPHGAVLTKISIYTTAAMTDDTPIFAESTTFDFTSGTTSEIETIDMSGVTNASNVYADFTDANIAADSWVYVEIGDDDVSYMTIVLEWARKEGN